MPSDPIPEESQSSELRRCRGGEEKRRGQMCGSSGRWSETEREMEIDFVLILS